MFKPHTLEYHIVHTLAKGSLTGAELLEKIQHLRPGTTKQGMYRALRTLKAHEVITSAHKTFSLHHVWLEHLHAFIHEASQQFETHAFPDYGFLSLEEGDSITYTFKSPLLADQFWGHAFSVLSQQMPHDIPIYIYNPHEWFLLAREVSEKAILTTLKKRNQLFLATIGTNTPTDREARQFFDDTSSQYTIDTTLSFKNTYYLNVLGSFLIEARFDQETADAIDAIYTKAKKIHPELKQALIKTTSQRSKTKLRISNNPQKAQRLAKKLSKAFYIPKPHRAFISP